MGDIIGILKKMKLKIPNITGSSPVLSIERDMFECSVDYFIKQLNLLWKRTKVAVDTKSPLPEFHLLRIIRKQIQELEIPGEGSITERIDEHRGDIKEKWDELGAMLCWS